MITKTSALIRLTATRLFLAPYRDDDPFIYLKRAFMSPEKIGINMQRRVEMIMAAERRTLLNGQTTDNHNLSQGSLLCNCKGYIRKYCTWVLHRATGSVLGTVQKHGAWRLAVPLCLWLHAALCMRCLYIHD